MSQAFFEDLEIPKPDFFLNAGSGSHAHQTARIMVGFEKLCEEEKPDLVIVVGDVNSALVTVHSPLPSFGWGLIKSMS
jgi:UDP-N-acetylglucosamine 2-epimerase (non-hydrolysing)